MNKEYKLSNNWTIIVTYIIVLMITHYILNYHLDGTDSLLLMIMLIIAGGKFKSSYCY